MGFDSIANSVGTIPVDWFIVGGLALLAALSSVRTGTERVCTMCLALPAAVLLMSAISSAAILGPISKQFATPVLQALLLVILIAITYVLVSRIGLSYTGGSGQTIQAMLAGVAFAVIVITLWIATPSLSTIWKFGPQVSAIFGEGFRFWLLLGSYAALAFSRRN